MNCLTCKYLMSKNQLDGPCTKCKGSKWERKKNE